MMNFLADPLLWVLVGVMVVSAAAAIILKFYVMWSRAMTELNIARELHKETTTRLSRQEESYLRDGRLIRLIETIVSLAARNGGTEEALINTVSEVLAQEEIGIAGRARIRSIVALGSPELKAALAAYERAVKPNNLESAA